jgi:hypothetical protein
MRVLLKRPFRVEMKEIAAIFYGREEKRLFLAHVLRRIRRFWRSQNRAL